MTMDNNADNSYPNYVDKNYCGPCCTGFDAIDKELVAGKLVAGEINVIGGLCKEVNHPVVTFDNLADLNRLPGPLSISNPVKWAAYQALMNARGRKVVVFVGLIGDPS